MLFKNKYIYILLFLSFLYDLEGYNISIIIPCVYKHACYLQNLLEHYTKQTIKPDEVVIALSECDKVNPEIINKIEITNWPFRLKLLKIKELKYAGENRNIACENSCGDLLICQDADDIPHIQRVEIIKYFFDHYGFDILLHCWIGIKNTKNIDDEVTDYLKKYFTVNDAKYKFIKYKKYPQYENDFLKNVSGIHYGNCSINKNVLKKVKWTNKINGQDKEFFENVTKIFEKNMLINLPILLYVNERSSWKH